MKGSILRALKGIGLYLGLLLAVEANAQPSLFSAGDGRNAVYVELLGSTGVYSVNYDRLLTDHISVRAGLMYLPLLGTTVAAPFTVQVLGGDPPHRLEIGGGLVPVAEEYTCGGLLSESDERCHDTRVFGSVTGAYRYQRVGGKTFVRVGAAYATGQGSINTYRLLPVINIGRAF